MYVTLFTWNATQLIIDTDVGEEEQGGLLPPPFAMPSRRAAANLPPPLDGVDNGPGTTCLTELIVNILFWY